MARSRKRRFGGTLILLLVLAVAVAGWGYRHYAAFVGAPLATVEAGTRITVEPGDSLPAVLRKLRAAGVQQGHDLEWRLLAQRLGAAGRLQVGEYELTAQTTPEALLTAMRDGRVVSYRFTIVPGWNIRDLRAALARAKPLKQTIAALDDAALMKALGKPGQHPEGRFLPETYHYASRDSDLDVLRRAHAAMEQALERAWAQRAPDSVLKSPDELLALASIVEKETGVAEERPRIAGLFARRLKIGMKLQTDPTVIYGLGTAYDGNLRRVHLETDTPYNTYTRAGLPPTPIAMPSEDALMAAARPAPGEDLFFVAVGDGSGRHRFARTLEEHNANVRAYLQQYRAARRAESASR
ncbi:MAG TPA: endolytic transglycosylase MltG [Lysobacter sp.]|nr:endolytic transglycosylase MltG [Lysobacter sp.]